VGTINSVWFDFEQATTISELLNKNNKLINQYNPHTILHSPVNYLVLFSSPPENAIIACIGYETLNPGESVLRHLCVHEKYRRQGLGSFLTLKAIERVNTPKVLAYIRNDNVNSLSLAESLGFMCTGWKKVEDHAVLTVERKSISGASGK